MGPDELLFWLSARREGSWVQFRSAVEEILGEGKEGTGDGKIPFYQEVRFALEQLAHVEFIGRGSEGGWQVAPPVLAVSPQPGGFLGVACGARSPRSLSRVQGLAGPDGNLAASNLHPAVVRVVARELERLEGIAIDAGLEFYPDAAVRMVSCLSRVEQLVRAKSSPLPFGRDFEVLRFAVNRYGCRWIPSSSEEAERAAEGLYRFVRFQIPEHFLKCGKRALKVDGQTGKFFVLAGRRRQVLRYDRSNRSLSVPGICRPPLLIDRALVLCTGCLPAYEPRKRMLSYASINEDLAGLVARSLGQNNL